MSEARFLETSGGSERTHADSARFEKDLNIAGLELRETRISKLREQYRQQAYEVDAANLSARIVDECLEK